MNKEVLIAFGLGIVGTALVLVIRDNMPKGSFKFGK